MAQERLTKTQQALRRDWEKRHPDKAAAERALRKANRATRKAHAGPGEATAETLAHASRQRQGALARLYEAGHITINQLAAGAAIASVHARITSDVRIGSMSMETRVDESRSGNAVFFERLGAVRAEVAYSAWRREARSQGLVLAVCVEECGISVAAKRFRMRNVTARKRLGADLDLWSDLIAEAVDEIDEGKLLAAQAGIL